MLESPRREEVLVTGASGFIGRHVCAALLEHGYAVRALIRSSSAAPAGAAPYPIESLQDARRVADACTGVAAVIHLAGRAHVLAERSREPLAEFRRTNVEGTRTVLESALGAGVPFFAFVSSVAAGVSAGAEEALEGRRRAFRSPYARSKLEAEALVRRAAGQGLRHAILRPPMVYGPGMKGNPLRLFRLVDSGRPVPVPAVNNPRGILYVKNLAAALLALLRSPNAEGTFFPLDPEALSTADLVRRVARALERPPRLVPVPSLVLRGAGRLGDLLSLVWRSPLNSRTLEQYFAPLTPDPTPLLAATGFVPPYAVDEALVETAAWFRTAERQ